MQSYDHVVLQGHVTIKYHYISITRVPIATKPGRMMTFLAGLLPIMSHDPLITWPCQIRGHSQEEVQRANDYVLTNFLLYFCQINLRYLCTSSLTFYHWNLNGIAAHDFVKILLIQGYITESNICLSETSQPANIGPQDATPTSPSNIPTASPKDPI